MAAIASLEASKLYDLSVIKKTYKTIRIMKLDLLLFQKK